jgi:hypothetical protein
MCTFCVCQLGVHVRRHDPVVVVVVEVVALVLGHVDRLQQRQQGASRQRQSANNTWHACSVISVPQQAQEQSCTPLADLERTSSTAVRAEMKHMGRRQVRTVSHLTMRPPMWPGMIMRTGKPWSGVSHLPFCLYATCSMAAQQSACRQYWHHGQRRRAVYSAVLPSSAS